MKVKKPYLFEVSWEVCNKVGGIYTVLESKSEYIKAQYGENYFLVGPYLGEASESQFEPQKMPDFLKKAAKDLEALGIFLHYGTWLIDSEPQVILVDFKKELANVAEIKTKLWDWYHIDSLYSGFDFDEPVSWSWAIGKVLETLKNTTLQKQEILVQCHEWMSGALILYLEKMDAGIPSVFTTHATFLGRVLIAHGVNFYDDIEAVDPEGRAREFGIVAKFSMEKAVTLNATVLTTVSQITANECEAFYGRKPEIILPNGFNFDNSPNTEEIALKHMEYKSIIRDLTMCYFFPYYQFNLNKTLFYFIGGRYEVHAKGIDLFIDSLSELNKKMKAHGSDTRIVAIFAIPGATKGIRQEIIQAKAVYNNIKQSLDSEMPIIYGRLVRACAGEFDLSDSHVISKEMQAKFFAKLKFFKRKGLPPLSTHYLEDEVHDPILSRFREKGLLNKEEDRVKVMSLPVYLNGADGLLNIGFYDFMSGCHMGVFPSFYEPWGYTPLEAGAMGVVSVTTDIAGFGQAVNDLNIRKKIPGVYVLESANSDYDKEVKELASILNRYSTYDKDDRLLARIHANQIAKNFSWRILSRHYFDAHELALTNEKIKAGV